MIEDEDTIIRKRKKNYRTKLMKLCGVKETTMQMEIEKASTGSIDDHLISHQTHLSHGLPLPALGAHSHHKLKQSGYIISPFNPYYRLFHHTFFRYFFSLTNMAYSLTNEYCSSRTRDVRRQRKSFQPLELSKLSWLLIC